VHKLCQRDKCLTVNLFVYVLNAPACFNGNIFDVYSNILGAVSVISRCCLLYSFVALERGHRRGNFCRIAFGWYSLAATYDYEDNSAVQQRATS